MANQNRKVPEYIKNIGNSFKYAVSDVTKDMFPSIVDFKDTNADVVRSVTATIKNHKQLIATTHKNMIGSEIFKAVDAGKSNVFADLKSGKFYNKDRASSSGDNENMYGMEDMGFNMADFGFDDDFDSESNGANVVIVNQGAGAKSVALAATGISRASLASAEHIVNNQRAQHAVDMTFNHRAFGNLNTGLNNITNGVMAINKFNTDVTKSFYDASTDYYTRSRELMEQQLALAKENMEMKRNLYRGSIKPADNGPTKSSNNMNDVILSGGGLDFKAYSEHVKKNLKDFADMNGLGMMQAASDMSGGPVALINELMSSPLKFIPKALLKSVIPKDFKSASKKLDNSFKNWATAGLLRLNEGEDDWEKPMRQFISKMFGAKIDNKSDVNLAEYNRGATAFDGVTRKAIIEVIPGYLAKILSALTNEDETVFDYESGKYSSKKNVLEAYKRTKNPMLSSDVGDDMAEILDLIQIDNAKVAANLKKDMAKYLKYFADKGQIPNPRSAKQKYSEHLYDMDLEGGEEAYDLISQAFLKSAKDKQMSFADDVVYYKKRQADRVGYLNKSMESTGLSAALNDKDINRTFKGGVGSTLGNPTDSYGKSSLDYLRDILDTLYTGIIVYPDETSNVSMRTGKVKMPPGLVTIKNRKTRFDSMISDAEKKKDEARTALYEAEKKEDERHSARIDSKIKSNPDKMYTRVNGLYDTDENTTKEAVEMNERLMGYMNDKYGINEKKTFAQKMLNKNELYKRLVEFNGKMKESSMNPFNIVKKSMEILSNEIYKSIYGHDADDGESANPLKRMLTQVHKSILSPISDSIRTNILDPLEYHLFDAEKGIMPKFNKFLDEKVFDKVKQWYKGSLIGATIKRGFGKVSNFVTGKQQLDADGNPIPGTDPNSIFGNMKSMFTDGIYKPFMKTLFGDKIQVTGADGKPVIIRKGDGLVNDVKNEFKSLFKGFGKVIFGDSEDADVTSARFGKVFKAAKIDLPKFGAGAGLGLMGSLFLPGGPLLGMAIGGFTALASKSDAFRELLFGTEEKNGLFKKEWGTWFKEKFPKFTAAGTLGIVGSLFLPGGPLLGAMIGVGAQWANTSDKFKEYMFGKVDAEGNPITKGLISKEVTDKFKALLPAGIAGMGVGGLAIGGPFGLAMGAILGSSLKYATSLDKFKDFMFGTEDDDGKRKGGIRGQIIGVFQKSIAEPLKKKFESVKVSFGDWFTKNIGVPFKNGLDPFIKEISLIGAQIKLGFSNVFKSIGDTFNKNITKPITDLLEEKMLKPMRKVLDKIFNRIGSIIGAIISAPFKAFGNMGDTLRRDHIRKGQADYMTEEEIAEFKRNSNPFTRFFMGLNGGNRSSLFGKGASLLKDGFAKARGKGAETSAKLEANRNKAVIAIENVFAKFSNIFDKSSYGKPKVTPRGKSDDADITISSADGTMSDGSSSGNSAKIRIKGFAKILGGASLFMGKLVKTSTGGVKFEGVGGKGSAAMKAASVKGNDADIFADDSTEGGKQGKASVESNRVRGGKRVSVRDMAKGIVTIASNTDKIKNEVEGQLDGSGYNLELISNILVDQFGQPSWLPTKLKRGARGNYKKQGFFEGLLSGVKTNILTPLSGAFSFIFKPIFLLGDAIKATGSALLEVGKEILMLPIDIFKFGLTAVKNVMEGVVEGLRAVGPALGEILGGVGSIVGLTLKGFGHVVEASGYIFAEALRGATTFALDFGIGIGHLVSKGIPFVMEKLFDFGAGLIDVTGKILGFMGKVGLGALSMGANFAGGMLGRGTKDGDGFKSGNVTRVIIEGGTIDNITNIDSVKKVKEIEKVSEVSQFNAVTDGINGINRPGGRHRGSSRNSYAQIDGSSALQLNGYGLPESMMEQLRLVGPVAPQNAKRKLELVNGKPQFAGAKGQAQLSNNILQLIASRPELASEILQLAGNSPMLIGAKAKSRYTHKRASANGITDVDFEDIIDPDKIRVGQHTATNIIAGDKSEAKEKRELEMLDLTKRNTTANEGQFSLLFKKGKGIWDGLKSLIMGVPALLSGLGGILPILAILPFVLDKILNFLGIGNKDGNAATEFANSFIEKTPVEDFFDRAPTMVGRKAGKAVGVAILRHAPGIGVNILKNLDDMQDKAIGLVDDISVTRVGKTAAKFIDNSKLLTAVKNGLLELLTSPAISSKIGGIHVAGDIVEEVVEKGLKKAPKLLAKIAVKLASYGAGIVLIIDAAFFAYDFNKGLMDVHNIWKTDPATFEPTNPMLLAAGLGQAISSYLFGIPEPGWLAGIIYKAVGLLDSEDTRGSLTFAQEQLKTAQAKYNAENGTQLTLDQYNDKVNKKAKFKDVAFNVGKKAARFTTSLVGLNNVTGMLNNNKIMDTFALDDKSQIKGTHRVAAGIGNQVDAMTLGFANAEKVSHNVMGFFERTSETFSNIGNFVTDIPKHIKAAGAWLGGIGTFVGDKIDIAKDIASKGYEKIKDPFELILKIMYLPQYMINKSITNIKEMIAPTIQKWKDDIGGWIKKQWDAATDIVASLHENAMEKTEKFVHSVTGFVKNVGTVIGDTAMALHKAAWEKTEKPVMAVVNFVKKLGTGIVDVATSLHKAAWEKTEKPIMAVVDFTKKIGTGLKDFAVSLHNNAWEKTKKSVTDFIDFFKGIGEKVNGWFEFDKYFDSDNSFFSKSTREGSFGQGKPLYGMGNSYADYGIRMPSIGNDARFNSTTKSNKPTVSNNKGTTYESDAGITSNNKDKDGYAGYAANPAIAAVNTEAANAPKGVFFSQHDPRWGKMAFTTAGDSKPYTISDSGCGPTAMAMVTSSLTGKMVSPDVAARFAIEGGYKEVNGGTTFDFFPKFASMYKLDSIASGAGNEADNDKILAALSNGAPTILMGKGGKLFGKNPHYVVATGYQDGRIYVNDPASKTPNQSFTPSEILPYATKAFFHQKDARKGGISGILDIFKSMIDSMLGGGQYNGLASSDPMFSMMSGDEGNSGLYTANIASPDVKIDFNSEGWMSGDMDAQPWLMERVKMLAKDHAKKIYVTSGYRSYAEQKILWDNAAAKYPDPDLRKRWVGEPKNPPTIGSHRTGMAMDLDTGNTWLAGIGQDVLSQYGLWRPMDWEQWHYEPIETGYPSLDERSRLIGSGELYNRYGIPANGNTVATTYAGKTTSAVSPYKPPTGSGGPRLSNLPGITTNPALSNTNKIASMFGKGKTPYKGKLDKIRFGLGPKTSINTFSSHNDSNMTNVMRTSLIRERAIAGNPSMSTSDIDVLVALLAAIAENTGAIVDNTANLGDVTVVTGGPNQGTQKQSSQSEQNNKGTPTNRSHFAGLGGKGKPQPINAGISTIAKGRKM